MDVWSLGCLLYYLACGQSPFERAAGEAGGSLMLAVVNGRVTWPDDAAGHCPDSLRCAGRVHRALLPQARLLQEHSCVWSAMPAALLSPGLIPSTPCRQLVARCLTTDPTARPHVGEVAAAADRILSQMWL